MIRTSRRDALREHLTKREIGTAIYYPLGLHQQDCFKYLGYTRAICLRRSARRAKLCALPIYPELSREAQRYVVEAIAEFFAVGEPSTCGARSEARYITFARKRVGTEVAKRGGL